MPVASQLKAYLDKRNIKYDVVTHPRTATASAAAEAAHIPGDAMLKSVVFHCDEGYMLTVVPSTHRVELKTLSRIIDKPLDLATEDEIGTLFTDCDLGAIPAVGEAYGLTVMCDDVLDDAKDVYFEAGDHRSLIHLKADEFRELMSGADHGHFSHHI